MHYDFIIQPRITLRSQASITAAPGCQTAFDSPKTRYDVTLHCFACHSVAPVLRQLPPLHLPPHSKLHSPSKTPNQPSLARPTPLNRMPRPIHNRTLHPRRIHKTPGNLLHILPVSWKVQSTDPTACSTGILTPACHAARFVGRMVMRSVYSPMRTGVVCFQTAGSRWDSQQLEESMTSSLVGRE